MRNLLFTLMALFMAGSAMAGESYLYMDDLSVTPGQQITVPVKASFDARVSGFQLDLVVPDGITPLDLGAGANLTVTYLNSAGVEKTQMATYGQNETSTRMMATFANYGYWDPYGTGTYEKYGVIKWEAGNYEEMLLLTMEVADNFAGGEIVLETQVASGADTRGGTVNDLGESGQVFSKVCYVAAQPAQTPEPVITWTLDDNCCTIVAEGEGEVHLYIDGMEVENPCVIERTNEDQTYTATATAQEGGKLISEQAVAEISIPAIPPVPVPVDGYELTMDDAEAMHGRTVVIPVSMTNQEPVTAFQVDLYLPEGFELQGIELSDRKGDHENPLYNVRPDGGIRILCFSTSLLPFNGNEGELFYITVKTPDEVVPDAGVNYAEFNFSLKNILLTNTSMNEIRCTDAENTVKVLAFRRGDVNGDGVVDVTDIVVAAQYILGYDPSPFNFEAGDMNGDGFITVTDVVFIINEILNPNMIDLLRAPALGENNDVMSGEDFSIAAGETRTVTIALDNDMDYTAFQLDLKLPAGLTASNFRMTDRAGSHSVDASLVDGKQRVMCYSPVLDCITGHEGALLTFDVTANDATSGVIMVDGIEMVGANFQTVYLNGFAMGVNGAEATSVKEFAGDLRIYTDGQNIIVESPIAQSVLISDVAGHAYSVDVPEGRTVIPARFSGMVVAKAGDKTAKLMVK